MFRTLALLLAFSVIALAACSGDDGKAPPGTPGAVPTENDVTIVPVTPVDKPASVPGGAQHVSTTRVLGQIIRSGGQDPRGIETRTLDDATCLDDVIRLQTSEEVIYAAFAPVEGSIPCDRFWNEEARIQFVGKEVAITLEVTSPRSRVLVETLEAAQTEFTVGGIWVE